MWRVFSTQSAQNVHSYVQILAFAAVGGRSASHSSQFGRRASMCGTLPAMNALIVEGRQYRDFAGAAGRAAIERVEDLGVVTDDCGDRVTGDVPYGLVP